MSSQSTTPPATAPSLSSLFARATTAGVLTPASTAILSGHLGPVVVAGAAGTALEDIEATDVTLVTVLIDASSSIAAAGLEDAVRDGQGALVDAFAGSKERDSVLLALWTFDDHPRVVHSYVPVGDAVRLDAKTYRGQGATALYDTWCDALAANVAYAEQLRDSGTPVRSVVVVITDGQDVCSKRRVQDCARLSKDLLASEQFVLAFVGVGPEPDFRGIARAMGIPDGSIEVQSTATASTLRHVFQMVSRSAIRASQGLVRPGKNAGFFRP
ncbi:VWA domain-containing protein [Myxococcota bacterium]|nr:VWA domain-containing protein [Myxococcota bacterium]